MTKKILFPVFVVGDELVDARGTVVAKLETKIDVGVDLAAAAVEALNRLSPPTGKCIVCGASCQPAKKGAPVCLTDAQRLEHLAALEKQRALPTNYAVVDGAIVAATGAKVTDDEAARYASTILILFDAAGGMPI